MSERVKVVSLLPHNVTFISRAKRTRVIPPSGRVAVVSYEADWYTMKTSVGDFPVRFNTRAILTVYEADETAYPFPPETEGTVYLVSTAVARHLLHRRDVICPNTRVNGVFSGGGKLIGVSAFTNFATEVD
jgi:hypothetical protein